MAKNTNKQKKIEKQNFNCIDNVYVENTKM